MTVAKRTIIVLLALYSSTAFAAYEVPGIPLEISGELNSHYRLSFVEQQKTKGYYRLIETERKYHNDFYLDDAYLGFRFNVNENINANLSLSRYADYYINYAYVSIDGIIPNHTIRVGEIETPWVAFEEKIWGWDNVERTAINRERLLDRTDLGVAVYGEFFDGLIQHDISFANGDGDEFGSERGKDIQLRITTFPFHKSGVFGGFSVNALGHYGNLFADRYFLSSGDPDWENDIYLDPEMYYVFGGLLAFQNTCIDAATGYFKRIKGTDISGLPEEFHDNFDEEAETRSHIVTAYATYHCLPWLDFFGRYDYVDPDIQRPDNPRTPPEYWDESKAAYEIIVAGCGFKLADGHLRIAPNYQIKVPEQLVNIPDDYQYSIWHAQFIPLQPYFYVNIDLSF